MAAAKEAVVIVLDVGHSMTQAPPGHATPLETSAKAINMIIQRKMFANAKDEFALLLLGTEDTSNQLAEQQGSGYEHITVVRDLAPPDLDLLRFIHSEITPGNEEADFIDAIVVAMDLLANATRGKKFGEKKIYLFSDLGSPFGNDQLDEIISGMGALDVKLTLIGPDLYEDDDGNDEGAGPSTATDNGHHSGGAAAYPQKEKTPQQVAGENCLRQILGAVDGENYPLSHVLPMLSFFQTKSVKQTTTFRGPLEIGSQLKINVYGYIKVKDEKLASWKKLSAKAEQSANPDTMNVRLERSYHLNDDDDTEVEKENVAQGYRYGKTIVPLTKIDKDSMKLPTEKCLKVLQFTSSENIKQHLYLGDNVVAFVPQPDDEPAAVALSALIHALYELDRVAIVRYCFRKNAAPKLGFLSPCIKQDHEYLQFITLPFMEDLRDFTFASLNGVKKNEPSAEQLDAIDGLITSMDLSHAYTDEDGNPQEALDPKCTFNPVRQRVFQCVQHRSLNPDDPSLPDLDPVIASYMEPNEEFKARCAPECARVKDLFTLERVEKKKKGDTAEDVFKTSVDLDLDGGQTAKKARTDEDETDFSMAGLAKGEVTEVGTVTPVENFKLLINRKDVDMFDEAARQMRARILQLVMDSFMDQFYGKALDCVKVLRQEANKAGESEMFNNFLQELKGKIINQRGHDFWLLIRKESVTLISKLECPESTVSKDEAEDFLKDDGEEKAKEPVEEEMEDADELLAMM